MKQPITTANERVTRASDVISFRLNCCWSLCNKSSFVNEFCEKLSDLRGFLRKNLVYELVKDDWLWSERFSFVWFDELKQQLINENFLDGSFSSKKKA